MVVADHRAAWQTKATIEDALRHTVDVGYTLDRWLSCEAQWVLTHPNLLLNRYLMKNIDDFNRFNFRKFLTPDAIGIRQW